MRLRPASDRVVIAAQRREAGQRVASNAPFVRPPGLGKSPAVRAGRLAAEGCGGA